MRFDVFCWLCLFFQEWFGGGGGGFLRGNLICASSRVCCFGKMKMLSFLDSRGSVFGMVGRGLEFAFDGG